MIQKGASYHPDQSFEIQISEVEYRRAGDEAWLARIYQPQGAGTFPVLLDVHGGAWTRGRLDGNARMNRVLAASGMVVVAIDYRLAPEHPYPAQVADVNYATRWIKTHAAEFNADPDFVGALGASSGGHTVMLSAMRPRDPRYIELSLPDGREADASLAYILAMWPVLDSHARYLYARDSGRDRLKDSSESYFLTEEAMQEGNPQMILERGEPVFLPPVLLIQGTDDDNVPQSIPEKFVQSYRGAGGVITLELFPRMPHGFGNQDFPESDAALEIVKKFVKNQLAVSQMVV